MSVPAVKVTPAGRFGLEMLDRPWAGRVSATESVGGVGRAVFDTTMV